MYSSEKKEVEEMVKFGIKLSGLGDRIYDKAETYSKGMRRRLALARTLMVKPKLAILDEPTAGLDVYASVKVVTQLKCLQKKPEALYFYLHITCLKLNIYVAELFSYAKEGF